MRFTKFGQVLLMGALSAGILFGVTSCVESYTVGFLYVTGTVTASTGDTGIVSGYKIDHNTGKLAPINGLPVSSGGANPVRAVLITGSRFLYVLNRGVNAEGNGNCTTSDPCQKSNITEFVVGGNGILTEQNQFFTQGINPFRLIGDVNGEYLFALDHDAPSSAACQDALGTSVTVCGDVTIFKIDQNTGRLSVVENEAVTSANCPSSQLPCPLTYFPVPANPVDFVLTGGYVETLSASASQTAFPYGGGSLVWPYAFSETSGQLTVGSNSIQPLGIGEGNAIVSAGSVIYVPDNEPVTIPSGGLGRFGAGTYPSQILPFSLSSGGGGALAAETTGIIPANLPNPVELIADSKGSYIYVADDGNNVNGVLAESGIDAYVVESAPYELEFVDQEPFGSGNGPQCIVEDPSDQFIYEANEFDSSITGRVLDPNSGELDNMRVTSTYALQGPPTWCLVDGRTG
jgi:hypothetical protein